MKFKINGTEYDPEMGLRKATLQTLFELKVKHGIGMKSLMASAKRMEKISDPTDLLEDPEAFQTFMVVIWLARRYAGERLSLEEANDDFGIADLVLVTEDGDAEKLAAADPKVLTRPGSARAGKARKTST